ncbi:MAG: PIG-L family deacetylase [Defluviicoccus sp.]|nr:MAG: PIG-L family deacetylase [Defluviicoccus sp.]
MARPTNPFRGLAEGYFRLLREERLVRVEPGSSIRSGRSGSSETAGTALIFAPHPDDESLTGALALRLARQCGMRVLVVPVTFGSRTDRRAERMRELHEACAWLGFGVVPTGPAGFGAVTPAARQSDPQTWARAVQAAALIIADQRPAIIFAPHAADRHPAHIGTHHLVLDALAALSADFRCRLIETEYWAQMADPNLMVESSVEDVADLVAAVSLHRGEVARSSYHLSLPAWMIDNVRRGTELVGGFRAEAPPCVFATLYRQSHWCHGALQPPLKPGLFLPADGLPEFCGTEQ